MPDALAIMVEAYQLLEMNDLADQALLVLNTNYPEHKSLDNKGNFIKNKGIRAKGRGWLNVVTFGLLG